MGVASELSVLPRRWSNRQGKEFFRIVGRTTNGYVEVYRFSNLSVFCYDRWRSRETSKSRCPILPCAVCIRRRYAEVRKIYLVRRNRPISTTSAIISLCLTNISKK